jgi:hypothetical protein
MRRSSRSSDFGMILCKSADMEKEYCHAGLAERNERKLISFRAP